MSVGIFRLSFCIYFIVCLVSCKHIPGSLKHITRLIRSGKVLFAYRLLARCAIWLLARHWFRTIYSSLTSAWTIPGIAVASNQTLLVSPWTESEAVATCPSFKSETHYLSTIINSNLKQQNEEHRDSDPIDCILPQISPLSLIPNLQAKHSSKSNTRPSSTTSSSINAHDISPIT